MKERICFSILTTRKFLKIQFRFQVLSISGLFGRSYGSAILFRDLLTVNTELSCNFAKASYMGETNLYNEYPVQLLK